MSRRSPIDQRRARHRRLRKKVIGSPERPRLSVNFSGNHIRAQIIDDQSGKTLASVQTTEKELASKSLRPNVSGAEEVGKLLADRGKKSNVSQVVFDRGGFKYHGKVKALADAARAGGLEF